MTKPKRPRLDQINLPDEVAEDAKRKGKRPPPKPITKTALRKMLETINAALALAGHLDLALQDVELDTLAEAWHDVISMYPQIGSMIASGNRLTVWGNALFVTFVIVERRRALFVTTAPGSTRDGRRDDRVGQNDAGAAAPVVTPLRASRGQQA